MNVYLVMQVLYSKIRNLNTREMVHAKIFMFTVYTATAFRTIQLYLAFFYITVTFSPSIKSVIGYPRGNITRYFMYHVLYGFHE